MGDRDKRREEYYHSGVGVYFNWDLNKKRWEPLGAIIKLHVRKKINPVPMFQKNVILPEWRGISSKEKMIIKLPDVDEISYDLEKGDLCAPYGKGLIKDFIFKIDRSDTEKGVTVKLHFSNPNDGIIFIDPKDAKNCIPHDDINGFHAIRFNYEFIGPRFAPENGYKDCSWGETSLKSVIPEKNQGQNLNFYAFRVRSKVSEDGSIISAKYGKILGGFGYEVEKKGFKFINFRYYFNPDGTRNLEHGNNINRNIYTGNVRTQ